MAGPVLSALYSILSSITSQLIMLLASLKRLSWDTKPQGTASVGTDEIIPMRFTDEEPATQAIVTDFTFRFDEVLDPLKLKEALERLLQLEEWSQLGARMRRNAQGKLQYQVPRQYTDDRPGFLFSQVKLDQTIDEHPVASKLVRSLETPTVSGPADDYHELCSNPEHPTNIDGWLKTDKPLLAINATVFRDATLLTTSYSHLVMDALGVQAFFEAWTAVLNGRADSIPRLLTFKDTPLTLTADQTPPERHCLIKKQISGLKLLLFALRLKFDELFEPNQEFRTIVLPGRLAEQIRHKAIKDLDGDSSTAGTPFISDNDVLSAWLFRFTINAMKISSSRPVMLCNIFNWRGVLKELPNDQAYIGNAVCPSFTFMTVNELLSSPLGLVAKRLRDSLVEQRTKEQVQAYVALRKKSGVSPLFGETNSLTTVNSNWSKGKFFDMDFSGAVVDGQSSALSNGTHKVGRPCGLHMGGHTNGFRLGSSGSIMGKDALGNWWMAWNLHDHTCAALEKELKVMAREKVE